MFFDIKQCESRFLVINAEGEVAKGIGEIGMEEDYGLSVKKVLDDPRNAGDQKGEG